MNILEIGLKKGEEKGLEQGIKVLIETCKELGFCMEDTLSKIQTKFDLSKDIAQDYMDRFW